MLVINILLCGLNFIRDSLIFQRKDTASQLFITGVEGDTYIVEEAGDRK